MEVDACLRGGYEVLGLGERFTNASILTRRGLRQGDLLPPFIFTLIGENLSSLVLKAKELGIVKGSELCGGSLISNLHMTPYSFVTPIVRRCWVIVQYLNDLSWSPVSGLIWESALIGVEMESSRVKEWAEVVGCGVGKLPFSYSGLPIGGNPRLKNFWTPVVEKVERRLAGWGKKYLSLGGRVTLIKSVLINQHTFCLCLQFQTKWLIR